MVYQKTQYNHFRKNVPIKVGRTNALTSEEESILATSIATTADCGFPLHITDIKVINKNFTPLAQGKPHLFQKEHDVFTAHSVM